MTNPSTHRLPPDLLTRRIEVVVIGCGGTGSAIAGGLPRLHQSMIALGHPAGLHVTFMDGDRVSRSNVVRQAFSVGDVGAFKAEVIAHRLNMFYGLSWSAVPRMVSASPKNFPQAHFVISCVDTRKARKAIADACLMRQVSYWLDCGNNAYDGQVVLGQPFTAWNDRLNPQRLETVVELYPETEGPEVDDGLPACSAAEALRKQGPFVNEVVAHHALALLARFFTKGEISYAGQFINLVNGKTFPIPLVRASAPVAPPARKRGARPRAKAAR
jgi:PRTRC genetic system ThiF family protein